MKRSDIKVSPEYFYTYINLVEDQELNDLLPTGGIDLYENAFDELQKLGLQTYAEGKWTVNEIIGHIIDCEIIFLNRLLRFARNDKTNLPGFEENDYAAAFRANDIPLKDLMDHLKAVRQVSVNTFKHLSDEELRRTGLANGKEISVLAIGFILIGHPIHHFNVLKERYFPLINL